MAEKNRRQEHIGELRERSLHASVKQFLVEPGDRTEYRIGRHVVDIVRENLLIEIQTTSFGKIRKKVEHLLGIENVRLVYPIGMEKWIVTVDKHGKEIRRRRSPRRGRPEDLFNELISIADIAGHPALSFEILLAVVEEIRCDDGRGSWRRRGVSVIDRRLVSVKERRVYNTLKEFRTFLPTTLSKEFTNSDLASAAGIPVASARKISYCFRKMGLLREAGKRGRELLFQRQRLPRWPGAATA